MAHQPITTWIASNIIVKYLRHQLSLLLQLFLLPQAIGDILLLRGTKKSLYSFFFQILRQLPGRSLKSPHGKDAGSSSHQQRNSINETLLMTLTRPNPPCWLPAKPPKNYPALNRNLSHSSDGIPSFDVRSTDKKKENINKTHKNVHRKFALLPRCLPNPRTTCLPLKDRTDVGFQDKSICLLP